MPGVESGLHVQVTSQMPYLMVYLFAAGRRISVFSFLWRLYPGKPGQTGLEIYHPMNHCQAVYPVILKI